MRLHLQEAIQQASDAMGECRRGIQAVKERHLSLLAANHELSSRLRHASAALLNAMRASAAGRRPAHPPCTNPNPATHALDASPTTPTTPARALAPLWLDTVLAPPSPEVQLEAMPLPGEIGTVAGGCDAAMHAGWRPPDVAGSWRMAAQLREARRAAAEVAQVQPEGVRWVLQSPYEVPAGAAISFSADITSSECMASMYTCYFIALLEEALLSVAMDTGCAGEARGDRGFGGDIGMHPHGPGHPGHAPVLGKSREAVATCLFPAHMCSS